MTIFDRDFFSSQLGHAAIASLSAVMLLLGIVAVDAALGSSSNAPSSSTALLMTSFVQAVQ